MPKRDVTIPMQDGGQCAAALVLPEGGAGAARGGAILYMDIFGPRASLWGMAERMAGFGLGVLVPDLFWRSAPYGPFDPATAFSEPETKARMYAVAGATSAAQTSQDTGDWLEALTREGIEGPAATVGYCFGGPRALHAAASWPGRVAAAASFHGGNLASENPDSPHLRAPEIKARVYVGEAGEDRSFPPEQSARLAQALREAGVDHALENYVGCAHGWCVPDHSVYDAAGAERHWKRLEVLFAETLF